LTVPFDTALISVKIYDKHDNLSKEEVTWEPALPGNLAVLQHIPPCDPAEPVSLIKQPQYGFQFFSVRLGDDHGNYCKYTASPSFHACQPFRYFATSLPRYLPLL
jgi:hypothetical protein